MARDQIETNHEDFLWFIYALGHYIVICGYEAGLDEFEIWIPATSMIYLWFLICFILIFFCI
jgi:hypothetical protein